MRGGQRHVRTLSGKPFRSTIVKSDFLQSRSNSNSSPSNLTSAISQLVRQAAWHRVMELALAPDYLAPESREIRMRSTICLPTGLGPSM